ncbi:aminotransferase class V-fold PLP-dependent enzyme [Altericroceibacterium endophyticum]|uniref:aminotransferase class V-fold PLP-dependent enzyme n=1 Tax=Altericroceibacterium endophyticum TaxID=1808508 RepID=UPI00301CE75A
MSRRSLLAAAAAMPIAGPALAKSEALMSSTLPDLKSFAPMSGVYLNSGTMHPIPIGGRRALDDYLTMRQTGRNIHTYDVEERIKAKFARLINASVEEIAFVQSTTAGEQLIIEALDMPASGGGIVTDTLHFFGSFYLYEELAKQGMDVTWLRAENGRIDVEAYEKAITADTRLVSLSLVSTYNGFEHDLTRICEIAHARGAMVYADIIHAAGTVPIDVRASGVDFAATASYKWLMGDFGLGFLYVRKDRLEQLRRPRYGYYQISGFQTHVYPFDPPGDEIADITARDDAQGHFAMGTHSHTVLPLLDWSLAHLLDLGIDNLVAYRRPLLERLHEQLPAKGYQVVTPRDSRTPLLTCVFEDAHKRLAEPLEKASISMTVSRNRFRFSPSFFNTMDDIDQALDALPNV